MERIGSYDVLGRIGRGGSADLLLATAPAAPAERVVIKRLHPHLAEEETYVRMFLDEARVMSLLPHPGIVRVLDLGEDGATCFTVLELVDGPSLAALNKLLAERGELCPVDVCVSIAVRVADALAFVHAASDPATGVPLELVHRDVAPANILVSRDGEVKLIDFGVVRSRRARELGILSAETTKSGVLKGHRATMSPEQVLGHEVDARADLYALGVVLWEALAGRRLLSANNALDAVAEIATSPPPPLPRAVPLGLSELVHAMLAKAPEQRPRTAREVSDRLAFFTDAPAVMRMRVAALVRTLQLPSLREAR